MKGFELILDQSEREIKDSAQLLGFVLVGHQHMPEASIDELLALNKVFNAQLPSVKNRSSVQKRHSKKKKRKKKN